MRNLLVLSLLLLPLAAHADECQPANGATALAAARARNVLVLEGPRALAFATEARAAGVPMPAPDYVFLDLSAPQYEAEWVEGAKERVAMVCSWQAKPASKFGQIIARWAKN